MAPLSTIATDPELAAGVLLDRGGGDAAVGGTGADAAGLRATLRQVRATLRDLRRSAISPASSSRS